MNVYFDHLEGLNHRVTISSAMSMHGVLGDLARKNVRVFHIGERFRGNAGKGRENISRIIGEAKINLERLAMMQNSR